MSGTTKDAHSPITPVQPVSDTLRHSSLSRRSAGLTIGVLLTIILLVWGGGFYALRVVTTSKEKELELRLETVGELESNHLAEKVDLDLLGQAIPRELDDESGFSAEEQAAANFLDAYETVLAEFLQRVVTQAQLRRAMLVDIHRRAIADSAGDADPFAPYDYLDIDRFEIETAASNKKTVATPFYSVKQEPYKRSYTPLSDSSGRVLGFLQLEASRGYFEEMRRLKPQLLTLMTVVTILVLLVGFFFHRLLQYALRAEETAVQADRLQAIGTLAAGLAHEIRNPLSIIRSYAEGLAEELPREQNDLGEMAGEMVEEVVRVDGLITQFLNFARPGATGAWQAVQVDQIMQSVVRLVKKDLEIKQLQVDLSIDGEIPPVMADEKSLRQVFLNILLNARDASQNGARVAVEIHSRRDRVNILIADHGHGISAEHLQRVFEPFFTTKPAGTGLGLSISRNIVQQFGGTIEIRSQRNHGTTVDIALPAMRT